MKALELSAKGQKLIQLYADMAENGYDRKDGSRVESAYNDFELRKFRNVCKEKSGRTRSGLSSTMAVADQTGMRPVLILIQVKQPNSFLTSQR